MSLKLRHIGFLAVLLLFIHSVATRPGVAESEWPQWRGPGGLGVSPELDLPVEWNHVGTGIRWVVEVPGEGISSPVVKNGRVFLTTAYEGRTGGRSKNLLKVVTFVLTALVLGSALLALRRVPGPSSGEKGWLDRCDFLAVALASSAFLILAVLIALGPDAIGWALGKLRFLTGGAGGGLARVLSWDPGNVGPIWVVSGGVALLGIAAAGGWLGAASVGRLLAFVTVVSGAVLHLIYTLPDQYTNPIPVRWVVAVDAPALGLALWYLARFLRSRRAGRDTTAGRGRALGAFGLILLAFVVFIPANFLHAEIGLLRAVLAYDLETGELLWNTPVLEAPAERKHQLNTYATPTPCADSRRVYAYFGSGLAGLDFDGEVVWDRSFAGYAESSRYGTGASPVLTADTVVVVQERERWAADVPSTWMAAFDQANGEERWRVEPEEASHSYATPLLVDRGTRVEMITATHSKLRAYEVGTGERLWSHPYSIRQMVPSLVSGGGLLAVSGGTHGEKETLVLQLPKDDGASVEVAWQSTRGVAEISSPVLYRGMLFTVDKVGIMTCADARTGEVHWRERLRGRVFASLVAADGKVYASRLDGVTVVVAAAREFELLAENDLGEAITASPAIAGRCLLIRTTSRLYCIEG